MDKLSLDCIRLGKIGFLNVLPIYYPLESGCVSHPFSFVVGSPAELNGLMADGRLDLSVVSSIEYARHSNNYYIIPDLSISCCGAVRSVLLLSKEPFERLAGNTILVSNQSHTSIALLKILLSFYFNIEVSLQVGNCSKALAEGHLPVALLAIGDEALRLKKCPAYPYRMDLGEAWHAYTGLPFVFALWVVQRKAVEKCNGLLGSAVEALALAKQWGRLNRQEVCRKALAKGLLSLDELQDYYRCLNYDLDADKLKGLRFFYRCLSRLGEIPHEPRIRIISPPQVQVA